MAEYFYSEDTEKEEEFITDPDLVRNKSTFNPKRGRNDALDTVFDTLENIPLENNGKRKQKSNLTKVEEQVMKSLSDYCTIRHVNEADKGGAVVIMDANYYDNKITQMLSNGEFYKKIPENHNRRTMQKVKNLLLLHKDTSSVTNKETLFLTDFEYRDSVFYGILKIHNSKIIGEAIKIQNSDYITCL